MQRVNKERTTRGLRKKELGKERTPWKILNKGKNPEKVSTYIMNTTPEGSSTNDVNIVFIQEAEQGEEHYNS